MPTTPAINLTKLNQQQAATLIGKRASWLREHAHEVPRNADGTYDGPKVVAWLLAEPQPVKLAELSDADTERAAILADVLVANCEGDVHAIIQFADSLEQRYGAAGLAALMQTLIDECRVIARIVGPPQPPEDEADIRARHAQQLVDALAWNGRTMFDRVVVCE